MDTMLLDQFDRLLDDICDPAAVRAAQAGAGSDGMWDAIDNSGFLDALVAEEEGGAGLEFSDMFPLIQAVGERALPLPLVETMVARALLAGSMPGLPAGPIVLGDLAGGHTGLIPGGATAAFLLADLGDKLGLFDVAQIETASPAIFGSLAARFAVKEGAEPIATAERPSAGLLAIAGVIGATFIAGAAARVMKMTVAYANERAQFGKPIGKQQIIQQNLSILAEQVIMVRMAAQIGCAAGLDPKLEIAAIAKQTGSSVVAVVANTAHAVHGAIGVSEEFDLQLLTRYLHEWRMAYGAETYWAKILGERHLRSDAASTVDYIRSTEPA